MPYHIFSNTHITLLAYIDYFSFLLCVPSRFTYFLEGKCKESPLIKTLGKKSIYHNLPSFRPCTWYIFPQTLLPTTITTDFLLFVYVSYETWFLSSRYVYVSPIINIMHTSNNESIPICQQLHNVVVGDTSNHYILLRC